MKRRKKRILAVALAIAIVLNTTTPVMAATENSFSKWEGISYVNTLLAKVGGWAESIQQKVKNLDIFPEKANKDAAQIVHSGKSGDLNWSIDSEGVLDISGVGDYREYATDLPIWISETYKDSIKKVKVNVSEITSTRDMFNGLSNVTSIDFNTFDTSNVTDMSEMFSGCSSLNTLDIRNWDTSNVRYMSEMFSGCSSLNALDIRNWDTSNVTHMSEMFYGCSSLNALDIRNWDTSNVRYMSDMFWSCSNLATLDIGNWNTSNVTDMHSMFLDCSNLETLDIGNWDTRELRRMDYMFSGCSNLQSLDLGNWKVYWVTDMRRMFSGCSNLHSLDIGNWNTINVRYMDGMFSGCKNLYALDLEGWDTNYITDMGMMFNGCSSLQSLDIGKWNTSHVKEMYHMFSGCSSLKALDIRKWNTSNVTDMRGMFSGCISLLSIDLSNMNLQNLKSTSDMFNNCSNLIEIRIPKNVGTNLVFPTGYTDSEKYVWKNSDGVVCTTIKQSLPTKMTYYRVEADNSSDSGSETPAQEKSLYCRENIDMEIGNAESLLAKAYGNTKAEMEEVTKDMTWVSENVKIATVHSGGFINCTAPEILISGDKKKEIWSSTGVVWVEGKGEGITTIVGTTKTGTTVKCKVTVTKPPVPSDSSKGNGGSFSLGIDNIIEPEKSNDSSKKGVADFFPGSWSLSGYVFPIQISQDVKKDFYTIKVAFGIGKSDWLKDDAQWSKYKKSIDDCKDKNEKYEKLYNLMDYFGATSGSVMSKSPFNKKPSLSVMGYGENKYDKNNNLISSTGKLVITAKWGASTSWQFITPVGPLYINAGGSISAEGKIGPQYNFQTQETEWVDGSLSIKPAASLEGGYGIDKIATIGAKGDLSIPIQLLPTQKIDLTASASVHAYVVFFLDETWTLATYKKPIYNSTDKKSASKNAKMSEEIWQSDSLKKIDTSFANKESQWDGNVPALAALDVTDSAARKYKANNKKAYDSVTDISTLMSGVLPSTLPMQAQVGDKKVMVFQAYDSSRDTLNGTVLKYSVWDGNSWSEPKVVNDTGCSDLYADMKVVNGKLALVWQKVKKKITEDVAGDFNAVLDDIAENSEIYFATFDDSTNSFNTPVKVTDNNTCDMMPRLCEGTDTIQVAWIRNDANSMTQAEGKNTIYTAEWDGNGFLTENKLTEASGTIDDYVFYQKNNSREVLFYGEDGETEKISTVFGTRGQVIEEISQLISQPENVSISSLQYADGKISFVCNGCVYQYSPGSGYVSSSFGGESAIGGSVKYCSNGDKNGYLWSTYDSETNTGKLMASMAVSGGYSEPVCIYEKEGFIWRSYSTVMDEDGNWQILVNAENCETGLNELQYITKKEEKTLEVVQLSIDENDTAGKRTGMDYCITNTGDSFIDKVNLQIKLADGQVIEKTIIVNLDPGESEYNTRFFDLADIDKAQKVTLQLTPLGQEANPDKIVEQKVGSPNVSITANASEKDGDIYIITKLSNTGKQDANTTVTLYDSDTKENSLEQKRTLVAANGEKTIEFILKKDSINYNENDAAYITLVAAVEEGDSDESNNMTYYVLYKGETLDEWVEKPASTPTPVVSDSPKPSVRPNDPEQPSSGSNIPVVTPTVRPSVVPTSLPAPTIRPSVAPTSLPAPTVSPIITPTLEPTKTPESTVKPTIEPSDNPDPAITSSPESNSNSAKKLKKGSKVIDKKTKAVYKITGTVKSRTVEYVKCTQKNPVSIFVPASVKLKGKVYKVTSVGKAVLKNSKKLKTVKLGKNVKKIGKQAFSGCMKLTNVTLGRNVVIIGAQAFNKCTALSIITIPSKVTKIGDKAFYQCKNLRYILVKTNRLTAKNVGSNSFGKGAANLRVKTDKNKWRLYAQIFMSRGMSKKALFIIDPVKLVI